MPNQPPNLSKKSRFQFDILVLYELAQGNEKRSLEVWLKVHLSTGQRRNNLSFFDQKFVGKELATKDRGKLMFYK